MIEAGSWRRRTRWVRLTYGLLMLAAIALLFLDRPASRPEFIDTFRTSVDDLAAPLMQGVSAPFGAMRSVGAAFGEHWNVHRQNRELRAEIEELEGWRELALSLRDTISAYEAILDVPGVLAAEPIVASIVAESGGPFQQARLLLAGADKGVQPGYPALTHRGLIGRVVSVGARSSRILLLTDVNSRVPVMTEDGQVHAILAGVGAGAPELDYVSGERELRAGDRVVTSADVHVFPRNLPIGVARPGGDGTWRAALYAAGAPPDVVWLYPYTPVAAPPPEAVTPLAPSVPVVAPEAATVGEGEDGSEGQAGEGAAPAPRTAPQTAAAAPSLSPSPTAAPAPAVPVPAPVTASDAPPPAVFRSPDPADGGGE